MNVYDSTINNLKLIDSTVSLFGCSSGLVDKDNKSSIIAHEHRYAGGISEDIFVETIAVDTGAMNNSFTSVWGPFRSLIVTNPGNNYISRKYDRNIPYNISGVSMVSPSWLPVTRTSTPVKSGILGTYSAEFLLGQYDWLMESFAITPTFGLFYVWSIHCYLVEGAPTGIVMDTSGDWLGTLILKQGKWVCSYGIKRYETTNVSTPQAITLSLYGHTNGSDTLRIADFQIVEFLSLQDATAYANSRAFAHYEKNDAGQLAYATVRYRASTPPVMTPENNYNISSVSRSGAGDYQVNFTDDIDLPYTTLLTPDGTAYIMTVGTQMPGYVQVLVTDLTGTPIDVTFHVSVI
jgi:hypothetical protein